MSIISRFRAYSRTAGTNINDKCGATSTAGLVARVIAEGADIGIAFDGNWESMTGDLMFSDKMQRCISVDIRYVMFVIDKFAGAGHLVKEMTLVTDDTSGLSHVDARKTAPAKEDKKSKKASKKARKEKASAN